MQTTALVYEAFPGLFQPRSRLTAIDQTAPVSRKPRPAGETSSAASALREERGEAHPPERGSPSNIAAGENEVNPTSIQAQTGERPCQEPA
jgi:hypothetical protein